MQNHYWLNTLVKTTHTLPLPSRTYALTYTVFAQNQLPIKLCIIQSHLLPRFSVCYTITIASLSLSLYCQQWFLNTTSFRLHNAQVPSVFREIQRTEQGGNLPAWQRLPGELKGRKTPPPPLQNGGAESWSRKWCSIRQRQLAWKRGEEEMNPSGPQMELTRDEGGVTARRSAVPI